MSVILRLWEGMTGTVLPFAAMNAPTGWLLCQGQAVKRSDYPALFARIGTVFGQGDGSTTFNVPDLRGEFIRGLDAGRNVDLNRQLGSKQADELKSHTHGSVPALKNDTDRGGNGLASNYSIDETGTTGATGGTETRPRNVALQYIIKT